MDHIIPSDRLEYFFTLNSSSLITPISLRSLQELSAERVASQRLRAELMESRGHLATKKQDVEKLQRLMEDLQTKVSELTVGQSSREQQQAKEVDRLQALLAHMEREIKSIRYVSLCSVALLSTKSCLTEVVTLCFMLPAVHQKQHTEIYGMYSILLALRTAASAVKAVCRCCGRVHLF